MVKYRQILDLHFKSVSTDDLNNSTDTTEKEELNEQKNVPTLNNFNEKIRTAKLKELYLIDTDTEKKLKNYEDIKEKKNNKKKKTIYLAITGFLTLSISILFSFKKEMKFN